MMKKYLCILYIILETNIKYTEIIEQKDKILSYILETHTSALYKRQNQSWKVSKRTMTEFR